VRVVPSVRQQPFPVEVYVPLGLDALMRTRAGSQPAVSTQSPGPVGVATQTVADSACAVPEQWLAANVAVTALLPPGSRTSCGADSVNEQSPAG